MNEEISFGGITTSGPIRKFSELFEEEYNDDGRMVAVSKETFHHDDNPLSFDYKYVVEVFDMRAFVGEDEAPEDNMVINLYLMPTPESLCKEIQHNILSCNGNDDVSSIWYDDMISYGGCGVIMESNSWHAEGDLCDVTDDPKCVETLDAMATVLSFIDGMRGFYIDRCWNRIGSTGWDTLEHAIHDEDWLKPALNRCATVIEEGGAIGKRHI